MSWLLLHQTGSSDQARRLAVEEADRVEPRLAKARPDELSVWGSLLVSGAVAAAREDQPDEADDLLNLAEAAATRLQAADHVVRTDYERPFGLPLVVMQSVDATVVTDRPGRALQVAKRPRYPSAATCLVGKSPKGSRQIPNPTFARLASPGLSRRSPRKNALCMLARMRHLQAPNDQQGIMQLA
jgi:hypothetical protein